MFITNLCLHKSSANGSVDYYTADLVENGSVISVQISKNSNGKWIAYNLKTDVVYPIESVGNNKLNIKDWGDNDEIVLGGAIRKNN